MENKEFAKALEERTLKFAVSIIKLAARLPNTAEHAECGQLLALFSTIAKNC